MNKDKKTLFQARLFRLGSAARPWLSYPTWIHCITSKSTIFQLFRDIASKFVGLLPDPITWIWALQGLVTSSSAMEAAFLDSPSVLRAPMCAGHAFRIPKTSVYRWQVQRQYTVVRIPEIRFTASGFYFCLCFFFFLFFLRVYTLGKKKKKKKKNIKIETIIQTGRTNTLLCRSFFFLFFFFLDYHAKRAWSLCVIWKCTSKCTLCTKRIMLSL